MERLQELEVLIAEQEKKADEAWKPIEAKCQEVNKTFMATVDLAIQAVVPSAKCTFHMDELAGGAGKCTLLDSNGKDIFGAGIDLYFSLDYGKLSDSYSRSYSLKVNVGSSGPFGKATPDQINKYKMLIVVLENLDNLESYLINQIEELKPLRQTYFDVCNELDKLKYEKEDLINKANLAKAEASLQVGNIYDVYCGNYWHKDFKGKSFAIIKEIQNKRILFRVGSFYQKADGTGYEFSEYDTYYYNKEDFCSRLFAGGIKHCVDINEYCKSNKY